MIVASPTADLIAGVDRRMHIAASASEAVTKAVKAAAMSARMFTLVAHTTALRTKFPEAVQRSCCEASSL